jgi:hypothetical protein
MSHRSDSPGRSDLSGRVIQRLEEHGAIKRNDTILNVHHYNSQQDQHQGLAHDASQIVRVRSNDTGRVLEIHSHDHGRYYSGYDVIHK